MNELPNLPNNLLLSQTFVHNGTIMLAGCCSRPVGHYQNEPLQVMYECLSLTGRIWCHHSYTNYTRHTAAHACTKSGTFFFGGYHSPETFEYLSKNSKDWVVSDNKIPEGFQSGYAVVISHEEIWLIGGSLSDESQKTNRILSFDTINHTFKTVDFRLIDARAEHCCAFIPGTTKIIVTGGRGDWDVPVESSEIIDVRNKTVISGPKMNNFRANHGIGILKIENQNRVIVFGGSMKYECPNDPCDPEVPQDTVEVYIPEQQIWEPANFKLIKPRYCFGFSTINRNDFL